MSDVVVVVEEKINVVQVSASGAVVTTTSVPVIVEVGVVGPQGPRGLPGGGGGGPMVGLLIDRPLIADAGDMFAATDSQELYIWF